MIKKQKYDIYLGFHCYITTMTTKQVKKLLKKKELAVTQIQGKNLMSCHPRYKKDIFFTEVSKWSDGTRHTWHIRVEEIVIVKSNHNPETGLPY